MSTPNRMQTHWDKLKNYIAGEWPKFSKASLNDINGDYDKFLFYLKDLYGNFPFEEAKARGKIQSFLNSLDDVEDKRY
jgi:hypothetical protein